MVELEPSDEDVQFLEDRINEHNTRRTGRDDYQPLTLFKRDDQTAGFSGDTGEIHAGRAGALQRVLVLDDEVRMPAEQFDLLREADVRVVVVGDRRARCVVRHGVPERKVKHARETLF